MVNWPGGGDCSLLLVALQVLCPGDLAVAESCGHLGWWPGSLCSSRGLPQGVISAPAWALSVSLFFLAGVGTRLESALGKPGKSRPISPLAPRLLRLAPALQPAA